MSKCHIVGNHISQFKCIMSFSGAAIAPPPSILEEPPVKRDGNYTLSYELGLYIFFRSHCGVVDKPLAM